MSSFDPIPNGFNLEPIEASELNLGEVPTVEIAVLPRRGFGVGKAFLWCVAFLVVAQVMPAVLVVLGALAAAQLRYDFDFSFVIQVALLMTQLAATGFSLLVLRYMVGKE